MALTVELDGLVRDAWLGVKTIRLGWVQAGTRTADVHACVADDGNPLLRLDVVFEHREAHIFEQAAIWRGLVAIGCGSHVHLVDPMTLVATSIPLRSYFGSLSCLAECMLIASAETIVRVEPDGSVMWTSGPLGIDGVVIDRIEHGIIEGDGQWDPPDGWDPFSIRLTDGASIDP